jgi:hypothetical protein
MPFSQRFIDHLLPLSDLMPAAGHLAIVGLDLRIGYSYRRTLAFVRLLPTHIGSAPHDASSGSALTWRTENVIGPSGDRV